MKTPGAVWFAAAAAAVLLIDNMGSVPGPATWRPWVIGLLVMAAWLALKWSWFRWNPDLAKHDRVNRALAGAVAGALVVGAYLAFSAPTHEVCTHEVRTLDGTECVSDEYVTVEGGDIQLGLVALGLAAIAFSVSMAAPKTTEE